MARKKRISEDDLFSEFDRELERMRSEMEDLMEGMIGRIPESGLEKLAKEGKGVVYGFSIRISPDGKPQIREFGNVKHEAAKESIPISDEREPLVDIIEGKGEITVIAELPGVDRKDINVSGEGKTLIISVRSRDRKYYKELEIPSLCDFGQAQARYNNGVLEIVVQKSSKPSANKKILIS